MITIRCIHDIRGIRATYVQGGAALSYLATLLAALLISSCAPVSNHKQQEQQDDLVGKSIAELRVELDAGRTTSTALVHAYLDRISALDRAGPKIQAIIAINPDALRDAQALDRERREHGARGPLHGIPILLKDNIESADTMPTTAGSLALIHNVTGRDAVIVANLRAAGAVILGKTNLSEWANFRSDHSISGWSAVGGLTKNPHVLDRTACGSSAGSAAAIAAEFAAASVGTETDGSIICPAAMNGVVGLKPTMGLLSQQGIVPIAHSQDTAGPMGRTVSDVAFLLEAMISACSASGDCRKKDYASALAQASLQGKRIGVLRFSAGRYPQIDATYESALQSLRDAGATLLETPLPEALRDGGTNELTVLLTEFKTDLNAYLANTAAQVTVRDLSQLIQFNKTNEREMSLFSQELFLQADATTGLDAPAYKAALAASKRLAGAEGLARLLAAQKLDLLVAPSTGAAWRIDKVNGDNYSGSFTALPAISGYPHLTVPMGQLHDLPVGISFIGSPWSEELLLSAGYVFEQRAHARPKATFKSTIETDEPAFLPQNK